MTSPGDSTPQLTPTLRQYAQVIEWLWERGVTAVAAEGFPDEMEPILDDALKRAALWRRAVAMGALDADD